MKILRLISQCALAGALFSTFAMAQLAAPAVRIVTPIDESQLVTLKGNVNPHANAANDRGTISASLPMTGMLMVLSRSSEQQAAFDAYVTGEYDTNSANYHQWLTPAEIGRRFGPASADLATISNWLSRQGFTVGSIAPDGMSIHFSGSAGVTESAFHTEIHNLSVNGKMHIANMTNPRIPAALAPVVVGIKGLHNFFPHPLHHLGQMAYRNSQTGKWERPGLTAPATVRTLRTTTATAQPKFSATATPQFGISVGGTSPYTAEDLGPWDFATIYNVAPLWTAGIDGTGQTIAIAGTSAIDIGEGTTGAGAAVGASGSNDVATFRTFFDLPTNNSFNTPEQISGNSEPLTVCTDTTGVIPYSQNPCDIGDLEENTLDVEWSGAVAKNAQIILVSSYPSSISDDTLYDSESYIVDHLTAHIMNVSYGECELGMGTAGNVAYYDMWQTAAAEGIAVFVAAGDSGSASCDDGGDEGGANLPYPAEYGLTVSGLATTPYNTAVGGTDFNWCPLTSSDGCASEAGTYWNSTSNATTESNAKGYIPELPWNDTCTSPLALPYLKTFFSGDPYSGSGNQNYSVTDAETACNALGSYAQQLESSGDSELLYLVDTVGGSGGASNCVANSTNTGSNTGALGACNTSATSTGATTNPDTGATQAALTLVNDGWPKPSWQAGVAGIPSDGVRDIPDVSFFASDGFLSSSAYLICVSAASQDPECTYSTSAEPFAQEVGGTSVATPAMAGVMALIDQKTGAAQGSPNAELYKLATKQTYGNCSAENGSASNGCYFNDIDQGTIAMACDYDAYVTTPSPNCSIAHAGDYFGILGGYSATTGYDEATGLGSLNVANVVNAWTSAIGSASATVTVTPAQNPVNAGDIVAVEVSVAATGSGGATPTGSLALVASGGTGTTPYTTSATLSNGSYTFEIPAGSLPGGTDTLAASYAGDSVYGPASKSAQLTVNTTTLVAPTIKVTPATDAVDSNSSLSVTVSVTGSGATPTGVIRLSGGGYTSALETIGTSPCTSASSCVFTIPANALTTAGQVTLTANYDGDLTYAAGSNTAQVTVTEATFTLTAGTPSSSSVAPGSSATVAVKVASVAGYAGSVSLTCQQTNSTATGGDGTTCTGGGSTTAVDLTSSATSGTVTFTIGTAAPAVAALERPLMQQNGKDGWLGGGGGAILALLVFFGIPARRRSWRSMLGVVVAMVAIGFMASCGSGGATSGGGGGGGGGGGSQSDPGTTAGTYTYTVTATPNPSVSPAVTTTFTVTVQ